MRIGSGDERRQGKGGGRRFNKLTLQRRPAEGISREATLEGLPERRFKPIPVGEILAAAAEGFPYAPYSVDRTQAGVRSIAGSVRASMKSTGRPSKRHGLSIHYSKILRQLLLIANVGIRSVVVQINNVRRLMLRVAQRVVERRAPVGVNGRDLHSGGVIPVPKRDGEGGIVDQFPQNSLEEV
nr:hypothetical protein Iba_chr04cCG6070 [Ipomoea batatas]